MNGIEIAEKFEKDGFLVVPNLFNEGETARLKTEIQTVVEDVRREKENNGEDWHNMMKVGVHVGVAYRSQFYRKAVADDRILDLLDPILGPEIEFLSDKAVFKDHDADFGSPWHQDHPYWKGSHKVSLWVALDDANIENGCLKVVPGSHVQTIEHADVSDGKGFGYRLESSQAQEEQAVSTPIAAGGAIVFHDLTLHASHANTAGTDRWVWIPTYRSLPNDDPPYPWAVAAQTVRSKSD